MESMFSELIKTSPILGVMFILWFYQHKDSEKRSEDYKQFVDKVQTENLTREKNLQETIHKNHEVISKNQEIIQNLTTKLVLIEDIKDDIEDIKEDIKGLKD